jgi:hypothetical protein
MKSTHEDERVPDTPCQIKNIKISKKRFRDLENVRCILGTFEWPPDLLSHNPINRKKNYK